MPDERRNDQELFFRKLVQKIAPEALSENLIRARLVHGNSILTIDEAFLKLDQDARKERIKNTDGLITNVSNTALSVTAADCTAVALYDPEHGAIILLHAGWRGTAGGIVKSGMEKMQKEYGTNPEHVLASIGPSISAGDYEVDTLVYKKFAEVYIQKDLDLFFTLKTNDKYYLNVPLAIRLQLIHSGISENNIEVSDFSTSKNTDLFPSARLAGGVANVDPSVFVMSISAKN